MRKMERCAAARYEGSWGTCLGQPDSGGKVAIRADSIT